MEFKISVIIFLRLLVRPFDFAIRDPALIYPVSIAHVVEEICGVRSSLMSQESSGLFGFRFVYRCRDFPFSVVVIGLMELSSNKESFYGSHPPGASPVLCLTFVSLASFDEALWWFPFISAVSLSHTIVCVLFSFVNRCGCKIGITRTSSLRPV